MPGTSARSLWGLLPVALLLPLAGWGLYRDGPPPGFTGGFGEQTCGGCHFGGEVDDPNGVLELGGVPATYESGKSYPIVVTLSRAGMEAGGFQLAARVQVDGSQAGTLAADPADAERLATARDRDVLYLHQRYAGSDATASDTLRWRVTWTAPSGGLPVVFHASANAANGDDSVSGDFVYTAEAVSRPK